MEIRPLTPADQAAMLELLTDESIKQTYMLPDFETKEDAIPLFLRILERSRDNSHFERGICVDGVLVGFLNDVEIHDGTIELGYAIHPAHQGKGYATAALKAAIEELFRLGCREVVAGAFVENAASLRVMEKAGMTPLEKTEIISYRGTEHLCVYRSVSIL
ncbi:MAG: GNAT family N-acetyltransferase [Faecousia sp.]